MCLVGHFNNIVLMDRQAVQDRFGIIGTSPAIQHVLDRVRQVARTDITVLIEGESGVGKELVANAIHGISSRRHKPLKIINTGAIPEGLIESELFGAEKGAFTGATDRRKGLFEDAHGGTVFLDEIGEMPPAAQVRLLRVLETGTFNRVGSSTQRSADVRVVAATNKVLGSEVKQGNFREDLYYRLSTVIVSIPPLRERKRDIQPIFDSFLFRLSQKYGTARRKLAPDAERLLMEYRWPGNVRELRNVAEQVIVLGRRSVLSAKDVRGYLRGVSASKATAIVPLARGDYGERGPRHDRELIYRALLEIRIGLRELKSEVGSMASLLRHVMVRSDSADSMSDIPLLSAAGKPSQMIEDTTYEIAALEHGPATKPDASPEALPTLNDARRALIIQALQTYEGNRKEAAKSLGISERTLYRRIKELDVNS